MTCKNTECAPIWCVQTDQLVLFCFEYIQIILGISDAKRNVLLLNNYIWLCVLQVTQKCFRYCTNRAGVLCLEVLYLYKSTAVRF